MKRHVRVIRTSSDASVNIDCLVGEIFEVAPDQDELYADECKRLLVFASKEQFYELHKYLPPHQDENDPLHLLLYPDEYEYVVLDQRKADI